VGALEEHETKQWHKGYWERIGAPVDFQRFVSDLVDLNILQRANGKLSFRYKYHYCFFVAYYLSEHIMDAKVRSLIRQLCGQLYHRETGDILLFLSHLSNDQLVPEEMLATADALLQNSPEANLAKDVARITHLQEVAPILQLPDGDPEARRLTNFNARDDELDDRSSLTADGSVLTELPRVSDGAVREALDIPAAHKTIQILGQLARNHADSLPIQVKQRIMGSLFALAKRLLGFFFKDLDAELPVLAEELTAVFRDEQPDAASDELAQQIGRHIFGLAEMTCFLVMKHLSSSVAHDLLGSVAHEVAEQMGDLPSRFFDFAISLETPGHIDIDRLKALKRLNEDKIFGLTLLRMLVVHHLYLFNVNFKIKQRACSELDIREKPSMLDQDRKALARKDGGNRWHPRGI
jgi:hypothetical protein